MFCLTRHNPFLLIPGFFLFILLGLFALLHWPSGDRLPTLSLAQTSASELGSKLQVGDVVFIRITTLPFRKVASATNSWTNHVGIVTDVSGPDPLIGESTFPFSRTTTLSKFVARSESGRVAVARLKKPLSAQQQDVIRTAVEKRSGIHYDTGFDLHSSGQFCSRFVHEVLNETTGIQVGTVENFKTLLAHNPDIDQSFWKIWYFGSIPWQRKTVTPASLLESQELQLVFDGVAGKTVMNEMAKSVPPYPGNFTWLM